ncbi:MAG: hypothetical protein A3G32_06630 [Deltaproteobacteria bacterium RIFCSPLOWO2_12_FULL_40_28]|nr:MAG: hypothetical protein A3C45_02725 [Deltaproteobacteria bacterium RIFCSPHIGHO2_02_FULL_40_28]OGQ19122.1 MAG: hypothetical protein A3E27_05815 [Deltaproteobacteria bacterium RIFCSPHIGHO2_12_FULL_40_32]OGQ40294.1 MAG: hypothetical protein A3I69_01255 [Deltaproteobacteria bacterium RIFCSPLOWO2_02_FULL_40_36]OGQ53565.1 MAG: hypothetical protein A3G32_06630 [Deltaproteobacteria bacterium RIFCSPLOWO2_12_FULL_40_28]
MNLEELMLRRLVFVSGKGGVGKTTVAISLGLLAAQLGKKTILVELTSSERIAPFFFDKMAGYKELELQNNLFVINPNPHDCLKEYVMKQVYFKGIYELFVNNRYVTSFLNAIPGLNELLMLGKIMDLEWQKKYDFIIVDAPATGHGVSFLEVPDVVMNAVKVGPLRKKAFEISEGIKNQEVTAFCGVTLAEEMPVVELSELMEKIKKDLKINLGPVFVNNTVSSPLSLAEAVKLKEEPFSEDEHLKAYPALALMMYERAKLNEEYIVELKKNIGKNTLIKLPHKPGLIRKGKDFFPLVDDLKEYLHA